MKRLLPVLVAIAGLAIGTAAGLFLRPAEKPAEGKAADETPKDKAEAGDKNAKKSAEAEKDEDKGDDPAGDAAAAPGDVEYVKLNNQFVVPVVNDGKVASLVVLSLSIEAPSGSRETVYAVEPKLRDALLQVLFRHANSGGFDGLFTAGEKMRDLRASLRQAARKVLGKTARDVLVIDIVRQDV